jgi:hypothetical protein
MNFCLNNCLLYSDTTKLCSDIGLYVYRRFRTVFMMLSPEAGKMFLCYEKCKFCFINLKRIKL